MQQAHTYLHDNLDVSASCPKVLESYDMRVLEQLVAVDQFRSDVLKFAACHGRQAGRHSMIM